MIEDERAAPPQAGGATDQPSGAAGGAAPSAGAPGSIAPATGAAAIDEAASGLVWVGVGASAGGLEALRTLISTLPVDANAAYIIVQHLAPQHRSMLAELIGRDSHLRVIDVADDVRPEANMVYVTPPNRDVVVQGDALRLLEPSQAAGAPKPSVDRFFRSLAEQIGDRAVGVVLSGTGTDGAHGVQLIHAAGGVTIAQSEETAKYNGMITAAIATGCIDLVLSPREIGEKFADIIRRPRNLSGLQVEAGQTDAFGRVLGMLRTRHGVDFRQYKPATLIRRIDRLMIARGVSALSDYADILADDPLAIDALFQDFMISVTSFFRDPEEFAALDKAIAALIGERETAAPVRIWTAGCATGEEAYSVAMMMAEALGGVGRLKQRGFQIFATDIDERALDKARRGQFTADQVAMVPEHFRNSYFQVRDESFVISKTLRDLIVFSSHNVCQDPPFLNLDLVTCRNLLIYFQPATQASVLRRFHYALRPNGLLFLGKSETVGAQEDLFRPAFGSSRMFRRRHANQSQGATRIDAVSRRDTQRVRVAVEADRREAQAAYAMFDGLARSVGPNALLVTRDLLIRRNYGDLQRYLIPAEGETRAAVDSLVAPAFRQEIRSLVRLADHRGDRRTGVARDASDDVVSIDQLEVYPIDRSSDGEGLFLVVFRRKSKGRPFAPGPSGGRSDDGRVAELERELAATRENLQSVVEAQETANEELQAFVEELQSSNEELQSTNEELETSNEEMESTNEELTTVNEELVIKSQELAQANQDLDSILTNVASPVLVVDSELRVRRCSAEAEQLFSINLETGRAPLGAYAGARGLPSLEPLVRQAMSARTVAETAIQAQGRSWAARAAPYEDPRGRLLGAVVALSETTGLVRAREALERLIAALPAGVTARDMTGVIRSISPRACENLGVDAARAIGARLSDLIDAEAAAEIEAADAETLRDRTESRDRLHRIRTADGVEKTLRVNRALLDDPDAQGPAVLSVELDVSAEAAALEALREREEQFSLAVEAGRIGLWDWDLATDELYWSARVNELLGLPENYRPVGVGAFFDRIDAADRDRVRQAIDAQIAGVGDCDLEFQMRRDDGAAATARARGAASVGRDGRPTRFIGVIEDVTESRRAAREADARNALMAAAQKLTRVGYWRYDADEGTLDWSDQIFEIHGLDPRTGPPTLDAAVEYYHPDDRARVRATLDAALREKRDYDLVARVVRGDGAIRLSRAIAQVQTDAAGRLVGLFGAFQDITEQARRQEELLRSNSELERFSYAASHELKEPVRLIAALSEVLLDSEEALSAAERSQALRRIHKNSVRLSQLVTDLVSYARVDGERSQEAIDLDLVIEEAKEALALRFAESGARVDWTPMPQVFGAGFHFRQLLQNLLSNALLHGGPKLSRIRISGEVEDAKVVLRIEDDGVGVPEAERGRLFEAFHRRSEGGRGTGLGLWICARIVMQYGGRIWCEDGALGGAAFVIELPSAAIPSKAAE